MYLFRLFSLFDLFNFPDPPMYLFAVAGLPLALASFTHALYILSFIFKMVNRKSANQANFLQKPNITALRKRCITHLSRPDSEADIQNTGLVVTHLQNHVVHTGNFVIQPGAVA